MYLEIEEKLYKEVCDATSSHYENRGNLFKEDMVIAMIEDLLNEVEHYKEKYEDLKQDLEDNYEPISPAKMYDIDDSYFN